VPLLVRAARPTEHFKLPQPQLLLFAADSVPFTAETETCATWNMMIHSVKSPVAVTVRSSGSDMMVLLSQ
jgi:hypothetical protein